MLPCRVCSDFMDFVLMDFLDLIVFIDLKEFVDFIDFLLESSFVDFVDLRWFFD